MIKQAKWITQLHLFRAFIHEIMRIANVTKLGLPHFTTRDIYVKGNMTQQDYKIPKGSVLLYLIEQIHTNKNLISNENWVLDTRDDDEEEEWNHEICLSNWLNKETNKFEMNKSFLTFGYGNRDCVGKQFALKQLYIIVGYLLLNYKFMFDEIDNDSHIPQIKTRYNGVTVIDPPIGVIVKKL